MLMLTFLALVGNTTPSGRASVVFYWCSDAKTIASGGLRIGLKGPLAEYDFIIVGAGSAGSVLASRLSEDHKTTVLVIEAGRGESLFTGVPILAPFFQQTHYTWPYLMERQPGVCLGMENQRCFWPRGRAVGGSSVINYMIYTRGLPKDWDQIAADGNYGWSYNEVLPYYTRSERATLRSLKDSRWHGRAGELFVEDVPFRYSTIPHTSLFADFENSRSSPNTK
ncbi:Glucose dehydrogenase [Eumeta japonica]|uniref:Glucose dehydrogenase n=1 Tax=Eumeta variegata TaxID=151549 RepID=A0A4C1ZMU1_EUMVA|nr:Glucose dehydrogenase [Eumeta japonica]